MLLHGWLPLIVVKLTVRVKIIRITR